MSLEKFHGENIDVACNLLESCGRYLLHTLDEDDLKTFNSHLDLMWRLREKELISSSQLAHIDQVFQMCRPVSGKLIGARASAFGNMMSQPQKEENLNQLEKFIRFLL